MSNAVYQRVNRIAPTRIPLRRRSPSGSGYGAPKIPDHKILHQEQGDSHKSAHEGDSDEDMKTAVASLFDARTEGYITTFAYKIFKSIGADKLDDETIDRLSITLPELLKVLELSLSWESSSHVVLIYRHRE